MPTIPTGVFADRYEGFVSYGVDSVNGLLNRGGVVVEVENGGGLMRRFADGTDDMIGFQMAVVVDDSAVDEHPKTQWRDRLYQEGADLLRPFMILVGRERKSLDSDAAREELSRGIDALTEVLEIDPSVWAAHWMIGKAHQAEENAEAARDAFRAAYLLQYPGRSNPDVAREYMFECLQAGVSHQAVGAAERGVEAKPEDAGLRANLGLALLIDGQLDAASDAVEQALEMAPEDKISLSLRESIEEVRSGKRPQPERYSDLAGGT